MADNKKNKELQYQKKLQYNNEYNRKNYRSFSIRFNIKDEADIIEWLESKEGVKSYVTELIQNDIRKTAKKAEKAEKAEKSEKASKKKKKSK
ncbi:MAG: hypothetical protein IKG46_00345 [Solobacterium sp.]|nr:hypothetical protein [Solobacterium sp.]